MFALVLALLSEAEPEEPRVPVPLDWQRTGKRHLLFAVAERPDLRRSTVAGSERVIWTIRPSLPVARSMSSGPAAVAPTNPRCRGSEAEQRTGVEGQGTPAADSRGPFALLSQG